MVESMRDEGKTMWDSSCSFGERAGLGDGFRDGIVSGDGSEGCLSHICFSPLGRVKFSALGCRGSRDRRRS